MTRRSSRTCAAGRIVASVRIPRRPWPPTTVRASSRLTQYITRCPLSLSRLVRVTKTGQVIYRAEKDACRAFPDPRDAGLAAGTKRNFQVLSAVEFLAEFTQHIPPKGAAPDSLLRLVLEQVARHSPQGGGATGSASGASGGGEGPLRPDLGDAHQAGVRGRSLACPQCGGTMKVISFIEPPQGKVIERILRHCGLWRERESSPRGPPDHDATVCVPEADGPEWCEDCDCAVSAERTSGPGEPGELTFVDEDTFWATF